MTPDETKALLQRLRHYGDNDRDAAALLIEQLSADLYNTEGRRFTLARQLESANGCISDWVKFGAEVTEALGLKVMSPNDIKATIARLIEDRARFPDRPDDIGRMIGSRFSNLKAAADENEKRCLRAMDAARAAETDAARYRWLLANYARGDGWTAIDKALNDGEADTQLSPAIDAAIAQQQASVQSPA